MGLWKRAAGWQRLWALGSALVLAGALFWLPAWLEKEALSELAAARGRVVAQIDLPACQPVRGTPYSQLAPIAAGAPCYDIYVWRKDVTEKLPLTLNNILYPMDAHKREIWFAGAMRAAAWAAFASLLLYGALFFTLGRGKK
jgi:hypothetical protein